MSKKSLVIGWLYYDLMNTYGDRGNVMILKNRCLSRGIDATVKLMTLDDPGSNISKCDILFMGGAQDRQQSIVHKDMLSKKKYLADAINNGVPGVYICGAYQLLGNYYVAANGEKIDGLGILDIYTEAPKSKERMVGDIIIETTLPNCSEPIIVGFENHGGKTFLGKNVLPFARVRHGSGNNGQDKTEGALLESSIGSYLHGPIFSKNPALADWLISQALIKKYNENVILKKMDDELEEKARHKLLAQYS